jgi:hypothetical protein
VPIEPCLNGPFIEPTDGLTAAHTIAGGDFRAADSMCFAAESNARRGVKGWPSSRAQIHEKLDLIGEMRDVSAMMAHTSSRDICICGIIIG